MKNVPKGILTAGELCAAVKDIVEFPTWCGKEYKESILKFLHKISQLIF